MVKYCQYIRITGPKKGEPCGKILRTFDDYCYAHKGQAHRQLEYKDLIDIYKAARKQPEVKEEVKKEPVVHKPKVKGLQKMIDRELLKSLQVKPVQEPDELHNSEESIESLSEESSEEIQLPKKTEKKIVFDPDDELVDRFVAACGAKTPEALTLLNEMLDHDLVSEEEYNTLKNKIS